MQNPRMSWGKGVIRGMELSPDQNNLAVICAAGVDIYDAHTLQLKTTFETGNSPVMACTFSPDSRQLFAGGQHVFIWDLEDEQVIRVLPDAGPDLTEIHVTEQFMVANIRRVIYIWNLDSGQRYKARHTIPNVSRMIIWDNMIIALGVNLELIDIRSGELIRTVDINNHKVAQMALRGSEIALLDWDKCLTIWNLQTDEKILTQEDMKGKFLTTWRDQFVVIDSYKRLCGIDAESKEVLFRYESRYRRVQNVVLSKQRLYCATTDGKLQMYDGSTSVHEIATYTGTFHHGAFSPDNHLLAASGTETIYVWDTGSGELHGKYNIHSTTTYFWFHNSQTLAVAIHRDIYLLHLNTGAMESFFSWRQGQHILPVPPYVAYLDQGRLHVWNGHQIFKSIPVSAERPAMCYDASRDRIAIGSHNQGIQVWDIDGEDYIFRHEFGPADFPRFLYIHSIALHGNTLAAVKGGSLYVWSVNNEWLRYKTEVPTPSVLRLLVSHDEQFIYILPHDGHVHIYRTEDGLLLHTIESPQYGVQSMALSSDGRTLATMARDGTIAFWDV